MKNKGGNKMSLSDQFHDYVKIKKQQEPFKKDAKFQDEYSRMKTNLISNQESLKAAGLDSYTFTFDKEDAEQHNRLGVQKITQISNPDGSIIEIGENLETLESYCTAVTADGTFIHFTSGVPGTANELGAINEFVTEKYGVCYTAQFGDCIKEQEEQLRIVAEQWAQNLSPEMTVDNKIAQIEDNEMVE